MNSRIQVAVVISEPYQQNVSENTRQVTTCITVSSALHQVQVLPKSFFGCIFNVERIQIGIDNTHQTWKVGTLDKSALNSQAQLSNIPCH